MPASMSTQAPQVRGRRLKPLRHGQTGYSRPFSFHAARRERSQSCTTSRSSSAPMWRNLVWASSYSARRPGCCSIPFCLVSKSRPACSSARGLRASATSTSRCSRESVGTSLWQPRVIEAGSALRIWRQGATRTPPRYVRRGGDPVPCP
eukprot:UN3945